MALNDSTIVEQVYNTSASVDLVRQQWFLRWPKSKYLEYYRRPAGAKQAGPKGGETVYGVFSNRVFSPHVYKE